MTLASTLAFTAGLVVEILLLWETSESQNVRPRPAGIFAPGLSRLQEALALTLAISWGIIGMVQALALPEPVWLVGGLQNGIMFVSFSFLFVFGMVHPKLLPRVDEQRIFLVNLAVLAGIWQWGWGWQAAFALPTALSLVAAWRSRPLSAFWKSVLYLWYLLCLFLMAYQSALNMFFFTGEESGLTLWDYFVGGAAGIFLLLHSIFLVRFFLMFSANILPPNRALIQAAMPHLMRESQIPPWQFALILSVFGGLIGYTILLGKAPPPQWINLLILLAAHWRPAQKQ